MIKVLTLSWNGLKLLQDLHPSLVNNLEKTGEEWRWYVRDNGSPDGTVNWLEQQEQTQIIEMSHNRDNFAQGMNSLIAEAQIQDNDLVLFLNNDIRFENDSSLLQMKSLLERTQAGMVGCKLNYEDGRISHAGIVFARKYNDMPWNHRSGEVEQDYDRKNRYFQAVTAACCLMPGNVLNQVGEFDPAFNWAFEDVDFSLRVSKVHQKPVVYCGETQVVHKTSATLKKNPINRLFLSSNVKIFKKKWSGRYQLDQKKYLSNPGHNLV